MATGDFTRPHVFLVAFVGQGVLNPMLRLGKILAFKGLLVTLAIPDTSEPNLRKANENFGEEPTPIGDGFFGFKFFDDGWDKNKLRRPEDLEEYMALLEETGNRSIPKVIKKSAESGYPVTCIIGNPFFPWVSDIAESLGLPSAILWVQSCACFSAYYHNYHKLAQFPTEDNPTIDVQLPGMPLLKNDEVPTYLMPRKGSYYWLIQNFVNTFRKLEKQFCILMETFEGLELETIRHVSKLCPIKPVGPLLKHPIEEYTKVVLRADLYKGREDCMEWLENKPFSSVVYVSFGTVISLSHKQWDEIANGVINSNVMFILVMMKPPQDVSALDLNNWKNGILERAGDKGKIVQWCPQEKVLSHPSISCFMTHCGWNSTMEAIASGVPVVCFSHWGDQVTNAKYLVDVWKVGMTLSRGEAAVSKLVTRDEVEKCLREVAAGPKVADMRRNALQWKAEAEAAVAPGGSSDVNVQAFVDVVKSMRVEQLSTAESIVD